MTTAQKHSRACKDFKAHFLEEHSYGYCEICSRSDKPMDAHHVYMASQYPKHKYLHDFRNIVLLCRDCHNKAHAREIDDWIEKIKRERKLDELFML